MKKVFFYLCLLVFIGIGAHAQTYSYEMQMDNFQQVSETEIQWDISLRKGSGSDNWALYTMQAKWEYDAALYNTGAFESTYLTLITEETDLIVRAGWFANSDFTKVNNGGIDYLNWATIVAPATGDAVTVFDDDQWKKVATFSAQLRKGANPHNFADIDPEFAFQSSGEQLIVRRCDYIGSNPNATMTGTNNYEIDAGTRVVTPAPGVAVNQRQLAGHWFSGNGNWSETARWNNVTSENNNTLPGSNSNAIINGNCTIQGTSSYSLLPNSGNGGELTVLTGPPPVTYTLTLAGNFGSATTQQIVGGPYNGLTSGEFVEGATISINTTTTFGFTFVNWSSGAGGSFTNPSQQSTDFTMPANNVTVTANWGGSQDNLNSIVLSENQSLKNNTRDDLYASLTIASGGRLTVDKLYNDNSNGAPAIVIQSDADGTGSLLHDYDNVPATIQRYIPGAGYHFVSIPLTNDASPTSSLFMWSYLFEYDQLSQDWDPLGISTTTPLSVNKGYMAYKYPGPAKWQADTTYSIAGPINNNTTGVFACNVTYPGVDDNHSLVPNPYPSAIDWDAASGWTKTNIFDAIWIWDHSEGNYAAYGSQAGTNGATRYIPVGQSFMVSASAASPVLSMFNDVRVHNSQAFYKETKEVVDLLRIKASANNYSDELVVRFKDASTPGFDGQWDVTKFYGNSDAPQVYTLSDDLKELSINSLPYTEGVISIPLAFKLELSGLCTFEASSLESFDPAIDIQLIDLLTGNQTDLRQNPGYTFMHDESNEPLRFKLLFNGSTGIEDLANDNMLAYYSNQMLYLNIPAEINGSAKVLLYNINGQLEYQTTINSREANINIPKLSFGTYIVKLISTDQTYTRKLLVD
jgi:hypothetical protein